MSIIEAIQGLRPTSTETKRKRLEVWRYYERIKEQDLEEPVIIIPYDDKRLNFTSRTVQHIILEINQTIKSEGEHVEGNKYAIDESTRDDLEEDFKSLHITIESDESTEWISRIFLFLAIVFLLIILSGDLPYFIELIRELPPN